MKRWMSAFAGLGVGAGLWALLGPGGEAPPVEDAVLAERVQSRLGRLVSYPRAIKVTILEGRVSLSGDILSREVDDLLEAIARIPGVRQVEDHLTLHEHPGLTPSLQGPRARPSRADWPPATRVVLGAAGGTLAAYGLARRGLLGAMMGLLGIGVSARAAINRPISHVVPDRRQAPVTDQNKNQSPRAARS